MGSFLSLEPRNPKRPASRENQRAPKRQRIGLNELSQRPKETYSAPETAQAKTASLDIALKGIVDKYGDEHEPLIPRSLDGVSIKTRCFMQIYYNTSECQHGILTEVREELLRVSQEGTIVTAWNPETGQPETEILLPSSFVVPIRELYVPKPLTESKRNGSFDIDSDLEEDQADQHPENEAYGLAEKYFCQFILSTVRGSVWPPLGLDNDITHNGMIGKQLKHGLSHKKDLRLVAKTELSPEYSPSRIPIDIKLGPDRQTTQYQLVLDTKWAQPENNPQDAMKSKTTVPSCSWHIDVGDNVLSKTKIDGCDCGLCLTKLDSIKALHLHLRTNHSTFKIEITPSTTEAQCFVILVSKPSRNTTAPEITSTIPEVNMPRSIFEIGRQSRISPDPTASRDPSTSADASEPTSKKSSPNTTPDSSSDSDSPLRHPKRRRLLRSRGPDAEKSDGSLEEDTQIPVLQQNAPIEASTPAILVPKTVKPLYDIVTKRLLKPGEPLPPPTASWDWRVQKHTDLINDYIDIPAVEKDFMNHWDAYMVRQQAVSLTFMPLLLQEFIKANRSWFSDHPHRPKEMLKHLTALSMSGRIDGYCFTECLKLFQGKSVPAPKTSPTIAIPAPKASPTITKQSRTPTNIAVEEEAWLELWDAYARTRTMTTRYKFAKGAGNLLNERSRYASPGQHMLVTFLTFHDRANVAAIKSILPNLQLPSPPTDAESEYIRHFDDCEQSSKVQKGARYVVELTQEFLAVNAAWLHEDEQRIRQAEKHLQELYWDRKIDLKFREECLSYLQNVEKVGHAGFADATNQSDSPPFEAPRNKGKGKEVESPIAPPEFKPDPTENDLIQGPRAATIRALGECECGDPVRTGEGVICCGDVSPSHPIACIPFHLVIFPTSVLSSPETHHRRAHIPLINDLTEACMLTRNARNAQPGSTTAPASQTHLSAEARRNGIAARARHCK